MLQQPLRARVERIDGGHQPVLAMLLEQQLDHARHRLARITLALRLNVEGHAQLGLASLVEEVHRHVADQLPVGPAFGGDLKPGFIGVEG